MHFFLGALRVKLSYFYIFALHGTPNFQVPARNRYERVDNCRRNRHCVDDSYVTRLECVQTAIQHQLEDMEKNFPNRRVALVTFESKVCKARCKLKLSVDKTFFMLS